MEQNRENLIKKIKQLKILRIPSLNNKGERVSLGDKDINSVADTSIWMTQSQLSWNTCETQGLIYKYENYQPRQDSWSHVQWAEHSRTACKEWQEHTFFPWYCPVSISFTTPRDSAQAFPHICNLSNLITLLNIYLFHKLSLIHSININSLSIFIVCNIYLY